MLCYTEGRTNMDAKSSILQVLEQQGRAVSMTELLKRVRKIGLRDDTQTKSALWALIAESKVRLTPERSLEASITAGR